MSKNFFTIPVVLGAAIVVIIIAHQIREIHGLEGKETQEGKVQKTVFQHRPVEAKNLIRRQIAGATNSISEIVGTKTSQTSIPRLSPEELDQKLHEFGLSRKKVDENAVVNELTSRFGVEAAKLLTAGLQPGQHYIMTQPDKSQPFILFSRLQTNCAALNDLTEEAALKISSNGQVTSGIYTKTGMPIPDGVLQCTFTSPEIVQESVAVNTVYTPPQGPQ